MIAEIGVFKVLVATKEGISPVPDEAKPISVFEFVQLYVVPDTLKVLANVTNDVKEPAQND
jgi:hypothetical protein